MEEQLSKKELLKLTGISYGQLYRWKREKLIPEAWFHKQASITGQETFFPKEAILKRVKRILELKDRYSLEEMAEMFSPEFVNRLFQEDELEQFQELDIEIAAQCMDVMEKDVFNFREILFMCVLSELFQAHSLSEELQSQLIVETLHNQSHIPALDHTFTVWKLHEDYVVCFYQTSAKPTFDTRIQLLYEVDLQEYSNQLKIKYQNVFHFTSE